MLGDGALAFQEFAVSEDLPLAAVQEAILQFVRGRTDIVLFGAQAVNAYVDEPRMTQDVDLLSGRAAEVAEELRDALAARFHIAVRVRQAGARGYRLYQVRQPKNRHLVDLRQVDRLPPARTIAGVLVIEPVELVAEKVIAYEQRKGRPKSGTDWRDLAMLLLTFPELKTSRGPVRAALDARGAGAEALDLWETLVRQEIRPEEDEY
jgi:hypothetical protein